MAENDKRSDLDIIAEVARTCRLPRIKCKRCPASVGLWFCPEWEDYFCPPCVKAEAEGRICLALGFTSLRELLDHAEAKN